LSTVAQVWQQHELIGNLVGREIRARYKQSMLGVLWSVITPLINTLLFTFVFNRIAGVQSPHNVAGQAVPYALFVYVGTMFWSFFSSGLTSGTDSMTANMALLTKVYFPREVFTLAAITARAADFGFSFIVFVGLMVTYGISQHLALTWEILLAPIILLIQLVLMLGLSFLLATVNLFYRDVRFVIGLILQIWMFLTPVNYPLARFLSGSHKNHVLVWVFLHMNPMTPLMLAYQRCILNIPVPPTFDLWAMVAGSAIFSLIVLFFGYSVFAKYEGMFAEAI
jgi:lipopolysaccharide transport system permease protein